LITATRLQFAAWWLTIILYEAAWWMAPQFAIPWTGNLHYFYRLPLQSAFTYTWFSEFLIYFNIWFIDCLFLHLIYRVYVHTPDLHSACNHTWFTKCFFLHLIYRVRIFTTDLQNACSYIWFKTVCSYSWLIEYMFLQIVSSIPKFTNCMFLHLIYIVVSLTPDLQSMFTYTRFQSFRYFLTADIQRACFYTWFYRVQVQ
jgi:hypothetical protein